MTDWNDIQSLSGKDRKALINRAEQLIQNPAQYIPKKGRAQKYIDDKGNVAVVAENRDLILIDMQGTLVPSLRLAQHAEIIVPIVKVDKGAIRFVTNGADIMRPGITHIDSDVVEGGLVLVVEETKGAPLCFGTALYDAVDMREMDNGKVVANLHYLSDSWWEFTP